MELQRNESANVATRNFGTEGRKRRIGRVVLRLGFCQCGVDQVTDVDRNQLLV